MGKYLVTGRGGTGKSAICLELQRRGYPAFDADQIPGLCRWENRLTGELTAVDPKGYIDFKKIAWAWQDDVMMLFFNTKKDFFLCGSSSNQELYYSFFDMIFVLMLDPATHLHRLKTRDFDYGKDAKLQKEIIDGHQQFAGKLIEEGAIPVDVTQPLENAADDILSHLGLPTSASQRSRN